MTEISKNIKDSDIREWSKKIRKGGVVSGHDYIEGRPETDRSCRVVKAVNELNVDVTIWRGDWPPSWAYVK